MDQTCSKRNWGIRITLSIGTAFETVSTEAIDEEGTISQLIGKADDAMYEAKRKGGNQAYFTDPMVSWIPTTVSSSAAILPQKNHFDICI